MIAWLRLAFVAGLVGHGVGHAQIPQVPERADLVTIAVLSNESPKTRPVPGPLERELARRNPALGERLRYQYRFSEGDVQRLPVLAAELVTLHPAPALIYCTDFVSARAAAEATATVPIVFLGHVDPVEHKFLTTLRTSSRNVTGVSTFRPVFVKLAEVALDAFPAARRMGVLLDMTELSAQHAEQALRDLAQSKGVRLTIHDVSRESAFLEFLSQVRGDSYDVLLVTSSTATWQNRKALVATLNRLSLPTVYEAQVFVAEGGLMSYGPSYADVVPRLADYVERVLAGTNPSSLPILQPTRLELVVNLKSAREQKIALPGLLLQRADRIIE